MANKQQAKRKILIIKLALILILGVVCFGSILFSDPIERALKIGEYTHSASADLEVVSTCGLKIHYINVGQADATLVELPDNTKLLIDAGKSPKENTTKLLSYLQNDCNISVIDYLILTHCDEDHAGGMAAVLDAFEVKNIYRPFQIACKNGAPIDEEDLGYYSTTAKQCSTNCYVNFIKKAYSETYLDKSTNTVTSARVYLTSEDLIEGVSDIASTNPEVDFTFEFYAPLKTSETTLVTVADKTQGRPVKAYLDNNNNASPIMMLTYKTNTFVFTGDAEKEVEADFLSKYKTNATVINKLNNMVVYKAGHHGSNTSSTAEFLQLINPTYTICSCDYNVYKAHPGDKFLERWEAQVSLQGANRVQQTPFRTDVNGTIIFGVNDQTGELVYCSGVEAKGFILRWSYIAATTFVVLAVIIISVKIHKNNVLLTARSVAKSTKKAQSVRNRMR